MCWRAGSSMRQFLATLYMSVCMWCWWWLLLLLLLWRSRGLRGIKYGSKYKYKCVSSRFYCAILVVLAIFFCRCWFACSAFCRAFLFGTGGICFNFTGFSGKVASKCARACVSECVCSSYAEMNFHTQCTECVYACECAYIYDWNTREPRPTRNMIVIKF